MKPGLEGAAPNGRFEQTRRALLARAGLAAGGAAGLAALSSPQLATAAPSDANKDPITVSDVTRFWGADPTGATDARQAIQNCINDSLSKAAVYFPPGSYKLQGTGQSAPLLTLPPKTRLIGHGALSVLQAVAPPPAVPTPPNASVFLDIQGDDVCIENLTLDANSSVAFYGIRALGTKRERIVIRGVELLNLAPTTALAIKLVVSNSIVENCHVHHTQRDGIGVNGDNVVVSGNVVEDCGDDHILAVGSGAGVSVVGNVVKANTTKYGTGIAALGTRVSIVGNVVLGGVHAGIEAKGSATDVVISGNTVAEAGNSDGTAIPGTTALSYGSPKGAGIAIFSSSGNPYGLPAGRIVISDNVIISPRSCGVFLIASFSSSAVTDVRIQGNSIWMKPLDSPSNPSLYNSDYAGLTPRRNGIGVAADLNDNPPAGKITDIRITDNDIRFAPIAGIHARGGQCMRWDIRDNSVLDCWTSPPTSGSQPGILLDGLDSAMVIGNRAQDVRNPMNQDYGIKIVNASGKYLVTDNDVTSNINAPGISPSHSDNPGGGPVLWIKDNLGDELA